MTITARPETINALRDVSDFLARLSRAETDLEFAATPMPSSPVAQFYYRALQPDVLSDQVADKLLNAPFRPCFLINGIILAQQYPIHAKAYVIHALAEGLRENQEYLAYIHEHPAGNPAPEDMPRLKKLEKRYFAYCAAQLVECGMNAQGLFLTWKADALDVATSEVMQRILESGLEGILATDIFTDEEKQLWTAVFDGAPESWANLQKHMAAAYNVPYDPAPTGTFL